MLVPCEAMHALCCFQTINLMQNIPLQMASSDKDFRFMATNDLMGELQKDSIKLDDDSERKVVKMLLRLLEDKNGEVQNLAVRWYVKLNLRFYRNSLTPCFLCYIFFQSGTSGYQSEGCSS